MKNALRARGLLTADGALTAEGADLRARVEAQTDAAAAAPYEQLGADKTQRLIELLEPVARSVTKQVFG